MLHRRASFGVAVPTATASRRPSVVVALAFYLLISVPQPPTLENGSATARGPSICMDFNLKDPWPAVDDPRAVRAELRYDFG